MTAKPAASKAAAAAAAADAEAAEPLKGGANPKAANGVSPPGDEVLAKTGSLADGHPHPRKASL